MSMLEAMAAGLPLVATDVGGLRDIVKRNGYLVGDYDEEALFSAMNQMRFLSADEYSAMQNESKKLVRQYSSDNMAERYLSIYRMLMER